MTTILAPPPVRVASTLADASGPSHGVITLPELRGIGYSDSQVRTMVDHGWLIRIRRAVYVVGFISPTEEARWARATRAHGDHAALDGLASARAWNFTKHEPRVVPVITNTRHRPVAGTRQHLERSMDSTWTQIHRGVKVLNPTRTIVRVARFERAEHVAAVMREAAFRRLLDMQALYAIIDQEAGKPGIANLVRAVALRITGSAGARSLLELQVLDALARLWPCSPCYNVRIGGRSKRYEVDLSWNGPRIGGEIDGPLHDEPDVRRDDLARDGELATLGWRMFRIHWKAFQLDPIAAIRPLVLALSEAFRAPIPTLQP
jgi:hypothetical protein